MQDDSDVTRVDLGKRPDLDTPRTHDLAGTKNASPGSTARPANRGIKLMAGAFLLLVVLLLAYVLLGRHDEVVPPPAPVAAQPQMPQPAAEPVSASPAVEPGEDEEEQIDYKARAYAKICRSLASEFVDSPSPTETQQRRTLMLYNVNRCSNLHIIKASAKGRGLDENEMRALDDSDDMDVGQLQVEER